MKFLFSDRYRWLKFCIAVACLFSMVAYSRYYGSSQLVPGTDEYIQAFGGKNIPFPYARVVENGDGYLIIDAAYGKRFRADWFSNPVEPRSLVSFIGDVIGTCEIRNVHHILLHKGYTFKLIISIIAVLVLLVYLVPRFGLDSKGVFMRRRK